MPAVTLELSWWLIEVLVTAAWLLTMFVSFQAGQRYQQFRKNPDEFRKNPDEFRKNPDEQVTVYEKKRFPEEVFKVKNITVLHLRSTCSSLSRSAPTTMSWCSKCSWHDEGKKS